MARRKGPKSGSAGKKDGSRHGRVASPGAQRRSTNFTHNAPSPSGKLDKARRSRRPAATEEVTGSDTQATPLSVPGQSGLGDAPDVPELYDPNFTAAAELRSGRSAPSNRMNNLQDSGTRSSNRRNPRTIADIMSAHLQVATPESGVRAVARMMKDRDVGVFPIANNTDEMKPIGIVTDRDIAIRIVARGQDPYTLTAQAAMSADPLTVRPDDDIQEAVDRMAERQVRRALVVDEQGRPVGIVAQRDIALEARDDQAEQLVQEVSEDRGMLGKGRYN